MSIADAVSRITQIQAQIAALQTGSPPAASSAPQAAGSAAMPASVTTSSPSSGGSGSFANTLAQAQLTQATQAAAAPATTPLTSSTAAVAQPSFSNALLSAPAAFAAPTGGASLPSSAASQLTTGQQQFAQTLAAQTGLDPGVVSAWVLSEESGGAAQGRQAQGNNDWLNIGYTDSGTYGSSDAVWSDPVSAANATAGWLRGEQTIPGYGAASPGIQSILQTAGQAPQTQIAALQSSGWASSGYPDLPGLYAQVAG